MGSLTANNILSCSAYITITFPGHIITARHAKTPLCYYVQHLYSTDCGNKCGHVLQDVVTTEEGGGDGLESPPPPTQKCLN